MAVDLTLGMEFQHTAARRRLDSKSTLLIAYFQWSFNTQPPEGGWPFVQTAYLSDIDVSTHSRPKAAGP